jgi:hypothetical protein
MSQIIESRYRVLEFDEEDALLNDIVDTGLPVHVNKEREEYSESLQTKIDTLEPGNIIEAEIQSESITRQDDTWKFIDLEVTDETRFHFIEDADNHSSHVPELAAKAESIGENTARTAISSDGESIGFITVGQDQGDRFWYGLQMGTNTHEFDIQNLEAIDEPPYEVIYTRNSDKSLLIFYHLSEKDTKVAQAVLSANR